MWKLLPKNQRNYFLDSALKFFIPSWGLPGSFLGLPVGFLIFKILLTKSPGSSKSFQEAPRKLQKNSGQNPGNNFVGFLEEVFTPKGHFEINWPLSSAQKVHEQILNRKKIAFIKNYLRNYFTPLFFVLQGRVCTSPLFHPTWIMIIQKICPSH